MRPFRLVAVVAESNLLLPLEEAVRRLHLRGFDLTLHAFTATAARPGSPLERALAEADAAVVSMVNTEREASWLASALERGPRTALIFTSQPELMLKCRIGAFDARRLQEREVLRTVAARLSEAGAALPPLPHVLMAALPRIEALLPSSEPFSKGMKLYARAAQHWLNPTVENLERLIAFLARAREGDSLAPPTFHPATALWHPGLPSPEVDLDRYLAWYEKAYIETHGRPPAARIGAIFFRQFILGENTEHYRAAVAALESLGLAVVGGFSTLDNTPLVRSYFEAAGVQAIVNFTGFNLVGSMGRPDPSAAVELLQRVDVPFLVPSPLLFQSLEAWRSDPRGVAPAQVGIQVVTPELDGGIEPRIFGGKEQGAAFRAAPREVERLARRVSRWVYLRKKPRSQRKIAIVIFSFPPDKGSIGTAAYLDVFRSLHALLRAMCEAGYTVTLPPSWEELAGLFVSGGAPDRTALPAAGGLTADAYRRAFPLYRRIERVWGAAPGLIDVEGGRLVVRGVRLGNLFLGVQPSFGYEGDPMRLLTEAEASPTHSFAAFYAWIRSSFEADALVHFGTHGALEFMPGKQVGLTSDCYPDALVDDLPHLYLYSVNNPSEATIAKRRSSAVIVSHLSPPLSQAGLYRELAALRQAVESFRSRAQGDGRGAGQAFAVLRSLAEKLSLDAEVAPPDSPFDCDPEGALAYAGRLWTHLTRIEQRLIPVGLHVVGAPLPFESLLCYLSAEARAGRNERGVPSLCDWVPGERVEAVVRSLLEGGPEEAARTFERLGAPPGFAEGEAWRRWLEHMEAHRRLLLEAGEIEGLLRALDGRYVPPSPGGDPLRAPEVLPTGRNMHALDPYRIPSRVAWKVAKEGVDRLLQRELERSGEYPGSIGVVLWGTDNIKSQGEGVAQALYLLGVEPLEDSLGRMTRLRLIPLEELGRPRIDVVMTLSGIFRDLFGVAASLLQEAVELAALVEEPLERNFVRRRSLAIAEELGLTLKQASVRLFSNSPGAYGTGVNHLVDQSEWESRDELASLFLKRKAYAVASDSDEPVLFAKALEGVSVTLQNLDSQEIGLFDVDHYYEYLGGLNAAVEGLSGKRAQCYVTDSLGENPEVRTLAEESALEARTKLLNPKWYEAMLRHGYQGVHEVANRLDHAFGWSATSGAVQPWVYQEAAECFALDPAMQARLERLNPAALKRMVGRLLEGDARGYWQPGDDRREALLALHERLEAHEEGIPPSNDATRRELAH